MKKITVLFFMIISFSRIQAQDIQISFAGTGASSQIDSVKVENLTQCTELVLGGNDILQLSNVIGINELIPYYDNAVKIYPNPITENCSIDFISSTEGIITIRLFDITGKRILQTQESLTKGKHTFKLSNIQCGTYLLQIESDTQSHFAKIVSINETYGIAEIKQIETLQDIDNQFIFSNSKKNENEKAVVYMQYNNGDRLKLTGFSNGIYRTISMLTPTQSETVAFNFVSCNDAENNHYAVVQIGTQLWMAENLKATVYRNGNPIPNIIDAGTWGNLTTGAYCDYNNSASNSIMYGRLYNFYTVADSRNVCPIDWHIPTDSEWEQFISYLGGEDVAGGKLKKNCTTLWQSPNLGATNETGFTAIPGGDRYYGTFYDMGRYSYWWSSTADGTTTAWSRYLGYYSGIQQHTGSKANGLSIRCLKD